MLFVFDMLPLLSGFIYFVGIWALAVFIYDNFISVISIIKSLLQPYFQPQLPTTLVDKYGKWAVITGATDGIGKEYAKELAKQGLNVVLISRTKAKLVEVCNQIESEYKVKTKWIAADFSKGKEVYGHIENELAGIPVGILVNNVGKMYDFPDALENVPEDVLWDIININIGSVTMMTHMIIPNMKKQGKGIIVNISSGSELQPLPYMAVYGATKRFVRTFSLAIEQELAEHNIEVQCVTPLFVVTKMNQYSETVMQGSLMVPSAAAYARSTVFTLGKSKETTGYWSHGLQYFIMKLSPERVRTRIGGQMCKKLRQEYLDTQLKEKAM
ncbi:hydroxysteroid dehydrogenase-like protein 1 [Musca domestica]|uniref:Hydroxysteroid dehydrogenase-like protein 1 n=1 Tax=Musca domestica TaxID=7370 RepID=T1PJR0_MUSDO|nr:hydroxysteroid dehydrogenase-like protein 1 [Musca domestica]